MSTPENPFAGAEPPIEEPRPGVPANVADAGLAERFPIWSLADVARIGVVLVLSLLFMSVLAFLIAAALPEFRNAKAEQIATDPRLVVPAQAVAYALTLWFIYRMIARHYHAPFLESLHWRWPRVTWPLYVVFGGVLSVCVQWVTAMLPVPKQLPIDQYFSNSTGIWFMAVFGTLFAPVVEELLFRGLLFPSLTTRIGFDWAVFATAAAFALVHASQLGLAWAPVLMLLVVGFVLTVVRARARSLAASTLVHVGYNGTIFVLIYLSTHGFRNLEKLTR